MRPRCGIPRCNRSHYAKGYCQAHYNRVWNRGNWKGKIGSPIVEKRNQKKRGGCSVAKCPRPHFAKSLCQSHYVELRKSEKAGPDDVPCNVPGCRFKHSAKGFCYFHWSIARAQAFRFEITLGEAI